MLRVNNLTGFGAGETYGPYQVTYIGKYDTPAAVNNLTSSSFNVGQDYSDRIILVGVLSGNFSTASLGMASLYANGVLGTELSQSTYGASWWKFSNVPGTDVIFTGVTNTLMQATLYVICVTGSLDVTQSRQASSNNDNNVSVSFTIVSIDDIFVAVGAKHGTGASNNWGGFTSVPAGIVNLDDNRIGTLGNGAGGVGITPARTTTTTQTVTATGSDSSKPVTLSVLRISKRI